MAGHLPTPQKTWLTATIANSLVTSSGGKTNIINLILRIHAQRKAWGHTVMGSGNGVTGGMDGVDRWNSLTDFPDFSNGVWMVYQNAVGAQDMLRYANFGEADWRFSHTPDGGYTGGSSSSIPTAAHENVLYFNSWFGRGEAGANPQFICNMWCSSDTTCFRQTFWFGGNNFGNTFYDTVDDPTPGWTAPSYGMLDRHGTNVISDEATGQTPNYTYSTFDGTGLWKGWGPHGLLALHGTIEGSGTVGFSPLPANLTLKNKISNTYRLGDSRCGLMEPMANADGGFHGRVFDLWWVQTIGSRIFTPGDTIPLDGTKQFVIIGDYMLPWNGGAFRIT